MIDTGKFFKCTILNCVAWGNPHSNPPWAEDNAFLYRARAAENRFFKQHAEKEEIAR